VLRDQADDLSVIPHLDYPLYQQYIQHGIIRDGMIPKLDNAFAALRAGVKRVIITRADAIGEGTVIMDN
jgi:acetylglutamate kinase